MAVRDRLEAAKGDIVSRYEAGESMESIGRSYDTFGSYIWQMLDRWGVEIRRKNHGERLRDEILARHAFGRSIIGIAKDLGVSRTVVANVFKKEGIDVSSRTSVCPTGPIGPRAPQLVAMYESGAGIEAVAKEFGCSPASVRKYLRRASVKIRSLRDYAYPVNEHFFDVIDSEEKAYVLGFMMADGCNSGKNAEVRLAIADRDILEAIATAMNFKGPLACRERPGLKPLHVLSVGSRVMSDTLSRAGCVPNKTYLATYPGRGVVPETLERHLIRGWNDGDGTITCARSTRRWYSRIVGTEAVCFGLQDAVERHLGFSGKVSPIHDSGRHVTWAFAVSNRDRLRRYLGWLYDGATICLPRKRDKYHQFLLENPETAALAF